MMMPADLLDFVRVLAVFLALFVAVPFGLAMTVPRANRLVALCRGLVGACLFAEAVSLLLGGIQLCLPGSTLAAYVACGVLLPLATGRGCQLYQPQWWLAQVHRGLEFAGDFSLPRFLPSLRERVQQFRQSMRRDASTWIRPILFGVAMAIAASGSSMTKLAFLHAENYSRALNLQQLTLGQKWGADGSVALLAPVVFLSGVDGAAVIRYTNFLFVAALALAVFAVVSHVSRSSAVATTATGLASLSVCLFSAGEPAAGCIAAIFWLLPVILWGPALRAALFSVALALLIQFIPDFQTGVILLSTAGVCLAARVAKNVFAGRLRLAPAAIAAGFVISTGGISETIARKNGPHQYESAATATAKIRRDFPRNSWLLISPVQELTLTYGHGWHMELSEFVDKYSADEAARPAFQFRFPVANSFVFVEKVPLTARSSVSLAGLGRLFEPTTARYRFSHSRASLQFRAARLLSAYGLHHKIEVYHEDDELIVYRVQEQPRM